MTTRPIYTPITGQFTALEQLERLFAPDIRVIVDAGYKVVGFQLLTLTGATVFLNRANTFYGDILGIDIDVVQRQMPGCTFEVVEEVER